MTIDEMVSELKNWEQESTVRLLKNACVSAGAGSGKTRVLATRYVYLVAKYGYMPKEILTLTYTNKAANEMYSRIYKSLIEYSEKITHPSELENIKKAIESFQEAKIQTLDSYCKALVSGNSYKFGISPDFSLDLKKLREVVNQKAVEFLLNNRENSNLQFFLKTEYPESFAQNFFANIILDNSRISEPIDFFQGYKSQLEFSKSQWSLYAKKANQLKSDCKNAFYHFGNNSSPSAKQTLEELMNKADFVDCEENPERLLSTNFVEWYEWFFSFSKLTPRYVKELGCYVEEARVLLEKMMPYYNFLIYADKVFGISELLDKFQKEVNNTKRKMGLLSFDDVSSLAIKCLLEFPEVREVEKKAYKAIMIDEFQDDNIMQKKLLYLLSEKEELYSQEIPTPEELNPEKLFFVGDEKQSIYKFRGADVEVFRNLSNELTGKGTLSTNYRSEPALIAAFNTFFGGAPYPVASEKEVQDYLQNGEINIETPVFKAKSTDLESFEAAYNLTKAPAAKVMEADFNPRVHFSFVNKDMEGEDERESGELSYGEDDIYSEKETEALHVAKKIKELLSLKTTSGKAVYEPKDIAILFRAATNQHVFERFLRSNGIPYSSGKPTSFFYDAPINDVISFMRVCLYETDFLSLGIFLTSPFVRLSENSKNLIISSLTKKKRPLQRIIDPFGEEFIEEISSIISEEDKIKILHGKKIVLELREFIKKNNIAKTINQIFYEYGYCYETLWNDRVATYSELYEYLFAYGVAADSRGESLADFLTQLENSEQNSKEMEAISVPLERGNAVQLMTIHGSKGLEFPVVFVVGITQQPPSIANREKAFFHEDFGLVVNLPLHPMLNDKTKNSWAFELCKELEIQKEIAETRRVLYVAMTRAEKELYLTGIGTETLFTKEEKPELKKVSFFQLLKPSIAKYLNLETMAEIKNAPFTFEFTPIESKFKANKTLESLENAANSRIKLCQQNQVLYENAKVEETPFIRSNYISPSKIEEGDINLFPQEKKEYDCALETEKSNQLETDNIIEKEKKKVQGFDNANFGTMVHAYIEHYFINKENDENFEPIIPSRIIEKLSPTSIEIVKNDAKILAKGFLESSLGKRAIKSTWCKSEYDFKMPLKMENQLYIADGQIDLIFKDEDSGNIVIVDFKTDSQIKPEIHYQQLKLYGKAGAELGNVDEKSVQTILYYLRFGKSVEV